MPLADYIKNGLPHWPNWITLALLKLNRFGALCYGRSYLDYRRRVEASAPDEKLIDMVNYAIANVPYYRKKYGNLVINSRIDFEEKIGFIDKDEVLANWDDFIADGIDRSECYVESTGGTSGRPMRFLSPRNRYVHAMYFWHRQLKYFGWNYDTVGVLRNHRLGPRRIYMVNPVMKQIIFDGFDRSDEYFGRVWKVLKSNSVAYLYCYPSSAYSFLKYCVRAGLDISFIKAGFLTSEEVTPFQYRFIHDRLGIQILASYGHSEKLCQAGSRPDDPSYYIDEQYGLTELIGPDGQVIRDASAEGEIVGTTFVNRFFPLIRYRTGDYSSYVAQTASDTENGRRLAYVRGRRAKARIVKHDGSDISLSALNLHSAFNDKIDGLQYVQTAKGRLTALVIKGQDYGDAEHCFLLDHLAGAMGGEEYVEIRYVDTLIFQENGKFLPLISSLT